MTPTELFNLALDTAGVRHSISIPSEVSREAEVSNRWFPTVRDQVLRAAFWPSATAHARLAVDAERDVDVAWVSSDPTPGWRYSYAAPADMLRPRYLSDFSRFLLTSKTDNATLISAQTEQAVLTYTKRQVEVDAWDADLRMAIIYALGANICVPLQGQLDHAQLIAGEANRLINEARANNANVDEAQYETLPPWIVARGYSGSSLPSRYFYPYGPAITLSEGVGVT